MPVASSIPLLVKLAYTAFLAVLVPYYVNFHGAPNFLWICNIALFCTLLALWLENRFLASMALVAVFLVSLIWLADYLVRLVGGVHVTGWTHYMFNDAVPLVIRGLSLYHAWLPFLLLWLVGRLGYDTRGWLAQTLLTWAILPICFLFTNPERALNGVFGWSARQPQTLVAPWLWLAFMMAVYPVCVYLPTHLVLRVVFRRNHARSTTTLPPLSPP